MRKCVDSALGSHARLQVAQGHANFVPALYEGTDDGQPVPHLPNSDRPNPSIRGAIRKLQQAHQEGLEQEPGARQFAGENQVDELRSSSLTLLRHTHRHQGVLVCPTGGPARLSTAGGAQALLNRFQSFR